MKPICPNFTIASDPILGPVPGRSRPFEPLIIGCDMYGTLLVLDQDKRLVIRKGLLEFLVIAKLAGHRVGFFSSAPDAQIERLIQENLVVISRKFCNLGLATQDFIAQQILKPRFYRVHDKDTYESVMGTRRADIAFDDLGQVKWCDPKIHLRPPEQRYIDFMKAVVDRPFLDLRVLISYWDEDLYPAISQQ